MDPIIDELRKVRDALAKKYDYDIEKLAEALRAEQEKGGRKVVSFPPRKPRQVRVRRAS